MNIRIVLSTLLTLLTLFSVTIAVADDAYDSTLEEARGALAGLDPATAKSLLNEATPLALTEEQKAELNRVNSCALLMEEFLKTMSNYCAHNKLDELKLSENDFVKIVEMNANFITVRAQGVNKRYMMNEVTPKLVRLLVGNAYKASPDHRAIFGVFEAFHPKGDRELARQLWSESSLSKEMLKELDVPRVTPPMKRGPDKRLMVPSQEEIAKGKEFISQKFASQIALATDETQRIKLSNLLIKTAWSNKTMTPGQRYACIESAIEYASDNMVISPLYDALEMKEKIFKTRTFSKRFKLIQTELLDETNKASCKDIAISAGKLLEECGATNRFDEAKQIIPIAKKAASAGEVPKVFKYAQQAETYLKKMEN